MKKNETRKARKEPSKAKAKAQREKASVKRATKAAAKADNAPKKVTKPSKGKKGKRKVSRRKASTGGGKALSDFTNSQKLKLLKPREISRKAAFRSGQTVAANLAAQKAKGFRGRRKYLRTQIAQGRVSLTR